MESSREMTSVTSPPRTIAQKVPVISAMATHPIFHSNLKLVSCRQSQFVLLLLLYWVVSDALCFRYVAPSNCQWSLVNGSSNEVSLYCRLRAINSQFDQTNFSVIPREHTASLSIECSDSLLYQSLLNVHSFSHLQQLKELSIEYCKIGKISPGVFYGLRDLKTLTLRSHNDVWPAMNLELQADTFLYDVPQLERLDLSRNNIWSFPDKIFCHLSNLQILNVSRNRLQDIADLGFSDHHQRQQQQQKQLLDRNGNGDTEPEPIKTNGPKRTLNDDDVAVTDDDESSNNQDNEEEDGEGDIQEEKAGENMPKRRRKSPVFTKGKGRSCPSALSVLDVSYNNFVRLPGRSLNALSRIRELHLDHNELSMMAADSLTSLDQLEILDLSINKLVALPATIFQSVVSLRELNLSQNSLSFIAPGLFSPLRHLELLSLSRNQLTLTTEASGGGGGAGGGLVVGSSGVFHHLVRLVVLDLSHNKISRVSSSLFADLYSLQALNLEHNLIETIESGSFASLSNLHTLKLNHNRLTVIDRYYFNGLLVLSQLHLEGNQIEKMESEAFKNCSNLEQLLLNGNRLERIPAALKSLTLLKTLDLADNHIRQLNGSLLRGLKNLQQLSLAGNGLRHVGQGSFPALSLLKSLDLSACTIETVDRAALDSLTSLQVLHLDANRLTSLENFLQNLPHLLWLNVSDNDLRWFDYALLPTTIQWLDLHKNKIEDLGNYLGLEAHLQLETLDASWNRITFITSRSLPHSLQIISLNDNLISVIDPNTFLEKKNLTRVDLYGNQLVTLNLIALRLSPSINRQNLPEFYLGGNPFQCDCDMEWLQRINVLNNAGEYPRAMDLDSIYCRLSYGRGRAVAPLVEASSSDFLCPYRAHCFTLCHCCEFDACDCEMTCPPNCTCYHDQSWSTNVVDCSSNDLTDLPSRIPMDATDVYLDGNRLPVLSHHAFIGKKNLKTLLLNSSSVETIQNNTFSGLKRLLVLHLNHNKIRILNGFEFEPLENLQELYLQNNCLEFLQAKTFVHLKNLQILHLKNNALTSYSVMELSANPYLRVLSLDENPWTCDCHFMREFQSWITVNAVKMENTSSRPMTCLQGRHVKSIHQLDCLSSSIPFNQNPTDLWMLIILTLAAAFVIFLLGLCLCCCRSELRALLYGQCGVRLCHQVELDDNEKHFHALVIYSAKDDVFVKDQLLSLLEEKPCYRICLQHRDSYDLSNAAAASYRLIVVLSNNFMETEWGKTEIRTLLRSTWQPGRGRVVLVVPDEKMVAGIEADMDLHLLFKSSTVIYCRRRLFRSQLLLALPEPRDINPSTFNDPVPERIPRIPCSRQVDSPAQHLAPNTRSHHHHKFVHQRQLPSVPESM